MPRFRLRPQPWILGGTGHASVTGNVQARVTKALGSVLLGGSGRSTLATAGISSTIVVGTPEVVTSFTVTNGAAGSQPFTIGMPFKKNDVPAGVSITLSCTQHQVDVRNRWSDGSARFAVLSGVAPTGTVTVYRGGSPYGASPVLEPNVAAVVTLTSVTDSSGATIGSGTLTFDIASARAAGATAWNRATPRKVREILGPVMSEFHYYVPTADDPHTHVWFYVRSYSTGQTEVETVVENGWFNVPNPGRRDYHCTVNIAGATVYNSNPGGVSPKIQHYHHTRWSRADWIGGDPAVTPKHNVAYLQSTNILPTLAVSSLGSTIYSTKPELGPKFNSYTADLADRPTPFSNANLDPGVGAGDGENYGVLPHWAMTYLTEGNAGAFRACVANLRAFGGYGIHYRSEVDGRPIRGSQMGGKNLHQSDEYGANYTSGTNDLPTPTGGYLRKFPYSHIYSPLIGHVLTGRWLFLEELQSIVGTGELSFTGQTEGGYRIIPWYENSQRAMAWMFRDRVQAEAMTPQTLMGQPLSAADEAQRTEAKGRVEAQIDYLYDRTISGVSTGFQACARGNIFGLPAYNSDVDQYTTGGTENGRHEFAGFQQHARCAMTMYMYDAEPNIDPAKEAKLAAVAAFHAKFPVGMLGAAPSGQTSWDWRASVFVVLPFGTGGQPNMNPTGWYASWDAAKSVWDTLTWEAGRWPIPAGSNEIHYLRVVDGQNVMTTTPFSGATLGSTDLQMFMLDMSYAHKIADRAAAAGFPIGGVETAAQRLYGSTTWANAVASGMKLRPDYASYSDRYSPVPYSLPSSGQALAISGTGPTGSNAMAIRPQPEFADSGTWNYAVFNSFGGGIVVPDYSGAGAYVLAGSGGHGHPEHIGAAIFDFQAGTWSRLDPPASQGGASFYSNTAYQTADTTGAPWYEITGSNGVPSPPHPYLTLTRVPASATYPKGAIAYITRNAVAGAAVNSMTCHVMNLATGLWSRFSDGSNTPQASDYTDGCAVFDPGRARYWLLPWQLHSYDRLDYFNPATGKFALTSTYSTYASSSAVGSATMLYGTYLIRVGDLGRLFFFDPDAVASGWTELATSDPQGVKAQISRYHEMAYFPDSGCFYTLGLSGGNTLVRVRPPATNPRGGTWSIDTVTVSGDTLPPRSALGLGNSVQHGRGLVYVPALNRLAWFAGGTNAVYLIHPGS